MPLTWVENSDSRTASLVRKGKRAESQITLTWDVFGTNDDRVVHQEANNRLSRGTTYVIGDYTFMVESYTLTYQGDQAWRVEAVYTKLGVNDDDQRNPLRRSRSFDTTGSTQHITQALDETQYPGDAPSQHKAIAVDANGVNGVDIVVPSLQWQEQYDVPSSYVTSGFIRSVASITGTTNNASFRGFLAGEVLFVGCSGSQEWDTEKGDGPWSLSYRFIASPNAGTGGSIPALSIGDITGINKKGHEYLWVRYENDVDEQTLLKKPKHVYVNRVYREGNFSLLGIGVT